MINTLKIIKKAMKLRHLTAADIARKLNVHYSTVTGMLSRNTIQVQKLVELSHVFEYNFFREIAGSIDYKEPKENKELEHQQEIEQLKGKIKHLELKVEVLEDVIAKAIQK